MPAVSGLQPRLEEEGIDVLLVNVQDRGVRDTLRRLDFRFTPTYIVLDAMGEEVWRGNGVPSLDQILEWTQTG